MKQSHEIKAVEEMSIDELRAIAEAQIKAIKARREYNARPDVIAARDIAHAKFHAEAKARKNAENEATDAFIASFVETHPNATLRSKFAAFDVAEGRSRSALRNDILMLIDALSE